MGEVSGFAPKKAVKALQVLAAQVHFSPQQSILPEEVQVIFLSRLFCGLWMARGLIARVLLKTWFYFALHVMQANMRSCRNAGKHKGKDDKPAK